MAKIISIQKVIKVGSSLAVTIPARDARYYQIKPGDELKIAIELDNTNSEITDENEFEVVEINQKLVKKR